jgi:hypothetical protein
MSRTRPLLSLAVIALFLGFTTASSKPKKEDATTSDAPAVADLDLAALTKTLGCDKKPTHAGCKLLAEFGGASAALDLSGADSVWYGETVGIGGAADGKTDFYFLQVGTQGGLLKGSARSLLPENPKETDDATRLLAATKGGSSLPSSDAAKFIRTATPPRGKETISKTHGTSSKLSASSHYVRRSGDRLLIVEYDGTPIDHGTANIHRPSGDAWVAELWKLR